MRIRTLVQGLARLTTAGLVLFWAAAAPAGATLLDYQFAVQGCGSVSVPYCGGTINGTSFAFLPSETMTFNYVADTSNIVSWSLGGTHGEELLGGATTFTLTDASGTVLQQGTFVLSDQMFVSVDNGNSSIGLGSGGVLPGAAGFPGNVANPLGFFFLSGMNTYNLSSVFGPVSGPGSICGTFDPVSGSCTIGTGNLALTNGGTFYYYSLFNTPPGTFSVTEVQSVPEPEMPSLAGLGLCVAGISFMKRRKAK